VSSHGTTIDLDAPQAQTYASSKRTNGNPAAACWERMVPPRFEVAEFCRQARISLGELGVAGIMPSSESAHWRQASNRTESANLAKNSGLKTPAGAEAATPDGMGEQGQVEIGQDLAHVVQRWPGLSQEMRTAILAVVRAAA
jgi:hypothetical protein